MDGVGQTEGAEVRDAFEACAPGDGCPAGTACVAAACSLTGQTGYFCSTACTTTGQRPSSIFVLPYLPRCVVSAPGGAGLCYDGCVTSADCGGGTACAAVPDTSMRVCVPAT